MVSGSFVLICSEKPWRWVYGLEGAEQTAERPSGQGRRELPAGKRSQCATARRMATGKTAMPLDDTHGVHHGGGVGAVSGAAAEAAHVERSLSALSLAAAGARAAPAAAAAAPAPASAAAASSSQAAPGSEVKATEASAAAAYPAHAGRADGQGKATEAQAHDSDVKTSSASDGGAPDAAG